MFGRQCPARQRAWTSALLRAGPCPRPPGLGRSDTTRRGTELTHERELTDSPLRQRSGSPSAPRSAAGHGPAPPPHPAHTAPSRPPPPQPGAKNLLDSPQPCEPPSLFPQHSSRPRGRNDLPHSTRSRAGPEFCAVTAPGLSPGRRSAGPAVPAGLNKAGEQALSSSVSSLPL